MKRKAVSWIARLGGFVAAAQAMLTVARPRRSARFPRLQRFPVQVLALGMGLGALLMFLFDATLGGRRRTLARDSAVVPGREMGSAERDLRNRAAGLAAEARNRLRRAQPSDRVLEARVREALGRTVSHPKAVAVHAHSGKVTLYGPILRQDANRLLAEVSRVPGVEVVENRLDVRESPGDVSDLQGGARQTIGDSAQDNWTPALRLLGLLSGAVVAGTSFTVGGAPRLAGGALGAGLVARSLSGYPARRLLGIRRGQRGLSIQKAMTIHAPVETVFDFWSNFENFPRFMANVREVRDLGEGRSHWVVDGPAGISAEWNARLTAFEPDRLIAWRSEPDSMVAQAGTVRFEPADGGTRVTVRMVYDPPAGTLGHAVATLFNSNPRQAMDEDLARFKSLVEAGKTSVRAVQAPREYVIPERTGEEESYPDLPGSS